MIIHLMPSEIARLVLGYLRESDCKETEKTFLNECKHLSEYAVGLKNGINYSTHINGKSLIDFIHEYSRLQDSSQQQMADTGGDDGCQSTAPDKPNERKTDEELHRLSEQLTKIESLLNKLIQSSSNSQSNANQNNYRLMSSPPILQTANPLLINTVGLNSTPIQSIKTQETMSGRMPILVTSSTPGTPVTPARSDMSSPRRKRVPRRRVLSGSSPFKPSGSSSHDDSMDQTLVNTSSEQIGDESEHQLRMDVNEPLVQPEFIVGEILNHEALHDVLADNINKIKQQIYSMEQNKELNKEDNNSNDQNIDPQEIHLDDQTVNTILANLESAPEFNNLLDKITEKELQMTPYKNLFSVESTSSSASSLNTPKTPQMRVNAQKAIEGPNSVIKNLMSDLKTPEKTITLYAARSPSMTTITPAKVTPVKIIRTDMTHDYSYMVNDKNGPIIVPKVSLFGDDYNLLQNTLANNAATYTVSFQSVPNQQFLNSNNIAINKPIATKRVDFTKPASELQMPRKILPKPPESQTRLSTTITPVIVDDPVQKQPLNANNNNLNTNETNRPKQKQSETKSPSKSSKQTPPTNQSSKRPNSGSNGSSPSKIRATNVKLPTVNILRKMNALKMNQFLDKVHSNNKKSN